MSATLVTRVQAEAFDVGAEHDQLARFGTGAIASFVGTVRNEGGLQDLTLEHYPGMTEASLADIAWQAEARFVLTGGLIVHRYGVLRPGEGIVLVLAASPHRAAALEAVAFMMDHLKTQAVFWKRERYVDGRTRWIEAHTDDDTAVDRWRV